MGGPARPRQSARLSDGEIVLLVLTFTLFVFGMALPVLTALGAIILAAWAVRRINSLLAQLAELRDEVARLQAGAPENIQAPLARAAVPISAQPTAPAPTPAAPPPSPVAPVASEPERVPAPIVTAAAPAVTAAAPAEQPAQATPSALGAEARLGTVWFSRVGGVLLLVGALLAYRYGITDNTVRTAIGFAAGIALLGLGHWGRRRQHPLWAQAITGTGLGVLYLTTHAAAIIFTPAIMSQPVAFALMVVITAAGVALAVGYNAPAIGLLAMLGGFATPFALSSGGGDFRLLFAYVAVLDLSLLLVAWFKRWPLYNYLLFAATWIIYLSWWGVAATPADYPAALLAATGFFAIFALLSVTSHLVRRQPARPGDLGLIIGNAFFYFAAGLGLQPDPGPGRAAFALGMAVLYGLLGLVARRRQPGDRLLTVTLIGLGVVFLTITMPVAVDGPWLTAAWALEGAVLVIAGFLANMREVRFTGLAALGLAALRLMFWETPAVLFASPEPTVAVRLFTFLVPIAACYATVWAYHRFGRHRDAVGILSAAASLFTLWYITLEVLLRYIDQPSAAAPVASALAIAAAWAAYGVAAALVDVRLRQASVRYAARAALGVALLIMLSAIARFALPYHGVPGWERTAAYAAVFGGIWLTELSFRQRRATEWGQGLLSLIAAAIGFIVIAVEMNLDTSPVPAAAGTLAAWGLYAIVLTIAGLWLRSEGTRRLAIVLTGITVVGSALVGDALTEGPWVWRIAAFVLAIGGAYAQTWLVHARARRGDDAAATGNGGAAVGISSGERRAHTVLALAAAGLTIVWLAVQFDAWYMASFYEQTAAEKARMRATLPLGISGLWGLYGFIVLLAGFTLRHRATRLLGTGILALTLLKVGLWDMWRLAVAWRYWIVLGLGAVFTGAAFMYSRLGRAAGRGAVGGSAPDQHPSPPA